MAARVAAYHRLAGVLRERSGELADLITAEMGKPIAAARAEVEKCAVTIEWIARNGPAILADEPVAVEGSDQVHVSYLPVGTVLGVMPWNFPLWQVIRAAGPIMLSGNGFLLKHAPNVMGSAHALERAFDDAGFPRGIFANLSADNDAVARVIEDDRIAAVTLTAACAPGRLWQGSRAGRSRRACSNWGQRCLHRAGRCECGSGGEGGDRGAFQNTGQVCLAAKRFILERPIAEAFTAQFVAAARAETGRPFRSGHRHRADGAQGSARGTPRSGAAHAGPGSKAAAGRA
jgi:succinate-semialdehyde dehydrogenase